jgi:quinol monooxygenase YgiN
VSGPERREVILARLQARESQVEVVRELLGDMARSTWAGEPDTLSYSVYQDRGDPTVFWVHEVFASADALQHHLDRHEWRRPGFDAALAAPAAFNFCRPLFPDGRTGGTR